MEEIKKVERRQNKRFQANEGLFIVTEPYTSVHGRIIDISKGGLAFQYIESRDRPDKRFKLSIFLKKHGFLIENVNVETVSDIEITYFSQITFLSLRRCGVRFVGLKKKQVLQLENIIEFHTTEE